MRQLLNGDVTADLNVRLRRAANEAAALAWLFRRIPHRGHASPVLGSGGFEHRLLVFFGWIEQRQEFFFDVNVAGSAQAVTPAFSHDSIDPVLNSTLHNGVAHGYVHGDRVTGIGNIGNIWHVLK